MKKLILALEGDGPVVTDLPVEEPAPVIDFDAVEAVEPGEISEGIEAALESLQTLERLRNAFKKMGDRKPSRHAIKIGQLAIENIKAKTGIFDGELVVAQEYFTEDSVSLEGIGDTMKKIWEAIVRTFKAVWQAFEKAVTWADNSNKKKSSNSNLREIRDAVKSGKSIGEKISKNQTIPSNIASAFGYLGDNVTMGRLIDEGRDLAVTVQIVSGLVDRYILANAHMTDTLGHMKIQGHTDSSISLSIQAHVQAVSFISSDFKDLKADEAKQLLAMNGIDDESIADDRFTTLKGLVGGIRVVAYSAKSDTEFKYPRIEIVRTEQGPTPVIEFEKNELTVDYAEVSDHLTFEMVKLREHAHTAITKITGHQKKILDMIDDLFQTYRYDDVHGDARLTLRFVREISRSLTTQLRDLGRLIAVVDRSAESHFLVCEHISKVFSK